MRRAVNSQHLGSKQRKVASKHYSDHYDHVLYIKATNGQSVAYGCALIDEAFAICGYTAYRQTFRNWSKDAIAFLERFDR